MVTMNDPATTRGCRHPDAVDDNRPVELRAVGVYGASTPGADPAFGAAATARGHELASRDIREPTPSRP